MINTSQLATLALCVAVISVSNVIAVDMQVTHASSSFESSSSPSSTSLHSSSSHNDNVDASADNCDMLVTVPVDSLTGGYCADDGYPSEDTLFSHGPSDVDADVLLSLAAMTRVHSNSDQGNSDSAKDNNDNSNDSSNNKHTRHRRARLCMDEFPSSPVDLPLARRLASNLPTRSACGSGPRPEDYLEKESLLREKAREAKAAAAKAAVEDAVNKEKKKLAMDRDARVRAAGDIAREEAMLSSSATTTTTMKTTSKVAATVSGLAKEVRKMDAKAAKVSSEAPCVDAAKEREKEEQKKVDANVEKIREEERRLAKEDDAFRAGKSVEVDGGVDGGGVALGGKKDDNSSDNNSNDNNSNDNNSNDNNSNDNNSNDNNSNDNSTRCDDECDDDNGKDENPFAGSVRKSVPKDCTDGVCIDEYPGKPRRDVTRNPGTMGPKNGGKATKTKKEH